MPRSGRKIIKITKAVVDRLELIPGRQVYYWDADLPGFGLYTGATAKSYFAQRTMGGRGRNRKTVRITIGKHGIFTPEEARREARDLLNRMARGEDPRETRRQEEDQSITLREAWEQFSAMRTTLAEKTRDDYRRTLTRDLAHWLDRPLASISSRELIQEYSKQTANLSPSTAARNMRTFRSIYNFAMALHEHLPQNPADRLKKLRLWYRDPRRRTYIRPDQLPYWYAAVMRLENDHARDFFRLLLFTGMRRSEGLSLRWEHIDFSGLTLTVPRTKNGDPLILPLSTFLYELLRERRRRFSDAEWVFPGDDPTKRIEDPKKWLLRANIASGIKFTFHDLRRTFITIAEALDLSAYTLKRLLNHRTGWDVTSDYVILDVERLRAPMQRISDHLITLCEKRSSESVVELNDHAQTTKAS